MTEKGITEKEAEEREEVLLARDTRNIILGGVMSMVSSIITLFIVQHYLVPKTAAAAVAEYIKQPSKALHVNKINTQNWKPLSNEQLINIQKMIDNG